MEINLDNFLYAGLFLTEESKDILENVFIYNVENGADYLYKWKEYLDHCTIIYKSNNIDLDDPKIENILNYLESYYTDKHEKLIIDGIGKYKNLFAFRVKKTYFTDSLIMNDQPHITCCLDKNTRRPVDSNLIKEWKDIPEVKIDTIVKIINKRK